MARWIPILILITACKVEPVAPAKPAEKPGTPTKPVFVTATGMTDTVAGLVGQAVKIEVTERTLGADPSSAKTYTIADAGKVLEILGAIGGDQIPSGSRRRCPDTITLRFVDAAGGGNAGLALCNSSELTEASVLEGPEMFAGDSRGGVKLADEAALKKLLLEARATPKSN